MHALAECLKAYAEQHFRTALARDADAFVRPILVGPPDTALRELFQIMTGSGQHNWQLLPGNPGQDVVVLLVDPSGTGTGTGLSKTCGWDYAVSIRNSWPRVLVLAARGSWDNRPESLANTTETVGGIGSPSRQNDDPLEAHLASAVAGRLRLGLTQIMEILEFVRIESARLETAARDGLVWEVLERLLSVVPSASATDSACYAAGVPVVAATSLGFRDSYNILSSLGDFIASEGLRESIDKMKATAAAQRHGVVVSLDSLYLHLSASLISPTLMRVAPTRYYRVNSPIPHWYDTLSARILSDILAELDQKLPQDRFILSCTNALPGGNPVRKGPFVVAANVDLRASTTSGAVPGTLGFTRKVDRLAPSTVAPLATDHTRAVDTAPPSHRKPIKYGVEATNLRPGTVDVLILNEFECHGLVVVRDAARNGIPTYAARTGKWTQELVLTRGGTAEFIVFHADVVTQVSIDRARPSDPPLFQITAPLTPSVSFSIDVEDNDEFTVTLIDAGGVHIGEWSLRIAVDDLVDTATSRLEGLIREHRTARKCVPHAPDNALHRLELGSYLNSTDSWKPVLACWAATGAGPRSIDWSGSCSLGDVVPQIDPRPAISPPAALLLAREAVRKLLQQEQRCVSEIEINSPALSLGVAEYLRQYNDWLNQDPRAACWLDLLAVHVAEWNTQAGQHVATDEPVVVLLSPLHPLRLAWHVIAQAQLADSLPHACPGAGLLSPSHCPDAALLYLSDGQAAKPRAFFSLPSDHPHWAVLANTALLDRQAVRAEAMLRLADLGLRVQAITGGFTAQQTQDSLDEVNRLLPARATLRVGVVGEADTSSECGEGVFRWSKARFAPEGPHVGGSLQVEVFDTRGATNPTPERLAELSEITAERVRWFKLSASASVPKLDLTIIDQLGARSHEATSGATYSAIASGGLFRVRIREDFHEARSIVESRVASTRLLGHSLGTVLAQTIHRFEQLVGGDAHHTHFRFIPNQEAVGSRLRNAIFLAVTSSQIDPACIVRGTVAQSGYIWDYELPGVLGEGESSMGYYVVAQPTAAMCKSVEDAASLVANSPPSVPGLLEEVSRHGIPILKRLAGGGSQSRGELGLLLATRLLQDAFRPHGTTARLPVWSGNCIHIILPVDPYEGLFDRLRRELLPASTRAQRPDLVVVAIKLSPQGQPVLLKFTPVEVKFRAGGMAAADMREALSQAHALGTLLNALWIQAPPSELWRTCASALLAQFLDFGFRIYGASWLHGHLADEWAGVHQRVVQDVLEGAARVTVNIAGKLVVFDGSLATRVADLDGDNRQDTVIVSQDDARALLINAGAISHVADSAVSQLDFSFPDCGGLATTVVAPQRPASAPEGRAGASAQERAAAVSAPMVAASGELIATPQSLVHLSAAPEMASGAAGPPSGVSRVPQSVRQRVRDAFEGFIGNEPAVQRLTNDLLRALIEQPPHLAKNYLFTGLPSTGKTELARRMSRALGLPFIKLDGRGVSSRDKLFELVDGELGSHNLNASQVGQQVGLPVLDYPPLIVFIDEVHLVPRSLQEALLTMLEAADRTVVLSHYVARVHQATFLFATTRVSDIDAAFASRCDEIQLREYTEAEVARILRWKVPQDDWNDSVYESVARFGRCVPRIAIQLAEALETAIMVSDEQKSTRDHLEDVRRAREIDGRGLTRMDFEYLSILERSGTPVGEQNLLNLMRTVDKDRILNDVEPFLVRLEFIKHGPRGRELTSDGREYLLAHRAQG